jgi:hypothetical protein
MNKCPLKVTALGVAVDCGLQSCEWWNIRNERCSVFVIGDSLEDTALRLSEIKDIIDREVKL